MTTAKANLNQSGIQEIKDATEEIKIEIKALFTDVSETMEFEMPEIALEKYGKNEWSRFFLMIISLLTQFFVFFFVILPMRILMHATFFNFSNNLAKKLNIRGRRKLRDYKMRVRQAEEKSEAIPRLPLGFVVKPLIIPMCFFVAMLHVFGQQLAIDMGLMSAENRLVFFSRPVDKTLTVVTPVTDQKTAEQTDEKKSATQDNQVDMSIVQAKNARISELERQIARLKSEMGAQKKRITYLQDKAKTALSRKEAYSEQTDVAESDKESMRSALEQEVLRNQQWVLDSGGISPTEFAEEKAAHKQTKHEKNEHEGLVEKYQEYVPKLISVIRRMDRLDDYGIIKDYQKKLKEKHFTVITWEEQQKFEEEQKRQEALEKGHNFEEEKSALEKMKEKRRKADETIKKFLNRDVQYNF